MTDSKYMRKALALARCGVGLTSPNPPVGALVVKDGHILGEGWHHRSGEAHAEINAFNDAVARHGAGCLAGGTLYVTLEPCSTPGRTGACTNAILKGGLARVVIGAGDPNPIHTGRAAGILADGGVEVVEGIEEARCEELVRAFSKVQRTGLPWLIVKSALSLDGRVTRPPGEGPWLSSPESRADVQRLRLEADAIMSSGRTVRCDDPRFTLRDPELADQKPQPWRVILTSRDQGVPTKAQILNDEHADRTLIFVRQRLECVLRELVAERDVHTVLVEAGGALVGRLVDEGWADEVVFYLAPLLTGGPIPAVGGEGVPGLPHRLRLSAVRFRQIGCDVRLRALLENAGA